MSSEAGGVIMRARGVLCPFLDVGSQLIILRFFEEVGQVSACSGVDREIVEGRATCIFSTREVWLEIIASASSMRAYVLGMTNFPALQGGTVRKAGVRRVSAG